MSVKRNTLWNMLPLLTVTAVNVISVPFFYNALGVDKYALWGYVTVLSGMFGFADLGIGVAVGRYIGIALGKGDREAVREYWGTANLIAIPLLAAMGLGFAVVGAWFGDKWFNVTAGNERLLSTCFVVAGVNLFLGYYCQFWNILSGSHLDFKFASVLRTVVGLAQISVALVLAGLTGSPLIILIWSAFVNLLQFAVFFWHSRSCYGLGFEMNSASRARTREMAGFTAKTFASLVVNSVFVNIDRAILGRLAPAAQFNHYTISANAGSRIQGLGVSVMAPLACDTNQEIGRGGREGIARLFNELFEFTFGWYVLATVWIAVWNPVLTNLWLGPELGAAVSPLLPPIFAGFCFNAIWSISSALLAPLDLLGRGLVFNVAAGLALGTAVWLGWNLGGSLGVAYGFLASRVVVFAQDIYVIRKIGGGGWLLAKTWLHLLAQAGVGTAFYFATSFLPRTSHWQIIPAAIHGLLVASWLARAYLARWFVGLGARS